VKFNANQQLVTWSNQFTAGILPGESVEIVATSGAQGIPTWPVIGSGEVAIEAVADEEDRIFELDETNNVLSKTLFVFDSLPDVQSLNLTSMCSQDPTVSRRWRIRNPNSFPVSVTWDVVGTSQNGSVEAPPGDSFFNTVTVGGPNTTKIYWYDEQDQLRSKVKASGGAQCSGSSRKGDLKDAMTGASGLIYPNPASNSFSLAYPVEQNGNVHIVITDTRSKRVYEQDIRTEEKTVMLEVDVRHLVPGLYLLRISEGDKTMTHKLLIDR
ncbi:MAG: T9SS type A sorting domain-containing protein, partial [Cytophagales bacterium]|nr:T9SS type A sorting domain-containing protein [Cytophagales bacterium]